MGTTAGEVVRTFLAEASGGRRLDPTDMLVHQEHPANGNLAGREFVRRNVTRFYSVL